MHRSSLPSFERHRRSRLAKLVHNYPFMRGTLSVRSRECGKPNCCCARGELHVSLYLIQSHDGKARQLYVPKAWEERVRRAVHNHQQIQALIEELSELQWRRLSQRKE